MERSSSKRKEGKQVCGHVTVCGVTWIIRKQAGLTPPGAKHIVQTLLYPELPGTPPRERPEASDEVDRAPHGRARADDGEDEQDEADDAVERTPRVPREHGVGVRLGRVRGGELQRRRRKAGCGRRGAREQQQGDNRFLGES
jgi:hypothetical protein